MPWGTRKRWGLKLLALLALVMPLLASVTPARAAAITVTTHETEELSFTIDNPCTGEPVLVRGMVHRVTHVTLDSNQGTLVYRAHGNYQGISGVGLATGTRYRLTGPYTTVQAATVTPPFTVSSTSSFQLTGQGPDNNFVIKERFHITINATGEVTTIIDSRSTECR